MNNIYINLTRTKKIEAVEQALDYVGYMVSQREDGETYIGIYETLEKELTTLNAQDDAKSRILQRMASRTIKQAS